MLTSQSELVLSDLPAYLPPIIDRLGSYHPHVERLSEKTAFEFPFGRAVLEHPGTQLTMTAQADDATGLARVKDLLAVAVQLYAKAEKPRIVWTGDLSEGAELESFRLMRVIEKTYVTPHMLRIRLAGENLARFDMFGGMHIRMLFATPENPDPVWPILGENGLPFYPSDEKKPMPRAYTVRRLDVEAGWMDVDFVLHVEPGIASDWAKRATIGSTVGVLGPVGRPVQHAKWYMLGADETGLPAVGRLLESMVPDTSGIAFIEVANEAEKQALRAPENFRIEWLLREDANKRDLFEAIRAQPIPNGDDIFCWFAAEAGLAKQVRHYWRTELGLGRDRTLVAGYWQRDVTGFMAG